MLVAHVFPSVQAALRADVECFQLIKAAPRTRGRSIPNLRLDGWIMLEGSFEVDYAGLGHFQPAPLAGFSPMLGKPLFFRTLEGFRAINVKCFPHLLATRGFASLQLAGQVLAFEHFFPKKAVGELLESLRARATDVQKIEACESFLATWLPKNAFPEDDWLQRAMHRIGDETAAVEQLAAGAFVSVKTFERRFQQLIGMNPKTLCKLARFQRALKNVHRGLPGQSILPRLWEAGYYDQSHFIKDCRGICGLPPRQLFASLPRSITDLVLPL